MISLKDNRKGTHKTHFLKSHWVQSRLASAAVPNENMKMIGKHLGLEVAGVGNKSIGW